MAKNFIHVFELIISFKFLSLMVTLIKNDYILIFLLVCSERVKKNKSSKLNLAFFQRQYARPVVGYINHSCLAFTLFLC